MCLPSVWLFGSICRVTCWTPFCKQNPASLYFLPLFKPFSSVSALSRSPEPREAVHSLDHLLPRRRASHGCSAHR
ncbi:hypothetical protein BRADI_1g57791v3 [Brachypodium distachyon]|uniref:Secreted protein n=1 Tax=Brachypodium distachyon TaxID=15368 RepID=A0A0Q3K932_BRADI|nr:hypothetical protein BRADI_1g57791v3 [Brachypodium distachyon]